MITRVLPLLAAAVLAGPIFAKPIPWALGFAPAGRIPMVGDVNGDGYADLICVSPKGDSFIDIALNAQGMKCLVPQRANSNWGKDCQAACSGEFDAVPGACVVGLFDGDTLRLAHCFKDGSFKDEAIWQKLPTKLAKPHLANLGGMLIAWDESSDKAFLQASFTRNDVQSVKVPKGLVWIAGIDAYNMPHAWMTIYAFADGHVETSRLLEDPRKMVGRIASGSTPGAIRLGIYLDEARRDLSEPVYAKPPSSFPAAPDVWANGDIDGDGDQDLIQFRFGPEAHTGNNVLVYRNVGANETDSDHDGLTYDEESRLGTDPTNPDSDGDGLLDGWEVNGFRGLDMKSLGCDPKRPDIICLVSRFSTAKKEMVESTFNTIKGYYDGLGWALHPIFLDELGEQAQKLPWWQQRDHNLPAKWRGVVHWMQVSPFGGGQADQLGDGGGCGGNQWALYATFIHEFGHQLGLSHEGFYRAAWCPTYSSMMNYAYSYSFEDDIKKIRYSDGSLKDFVMNETDLDENLPLPYEEVKFLENGPYRYRLKQSGNTTLIDWNWNGVFGERHVRADINYGYSTTAGRRDEVGKTQCSPWTFAHDKSGFVLYGEQGVKADGKSDPSLLPDKPGWLNLRRLVKPFEWAEPIKIVTEGVTGDPAAISYKGEIVVAYPSAKGLSVNWIKLKGDSAVQNDQIYVDDTNSVPSLGVFKGRLFLFEWSPREGYVRYRTLTGGHRFSEWAVLLPAGAYPVVIKSAFPVSMAVDLGRDEIVIGLSEDQDKDRPGRWSIRRYKADGGFLRPSTERPLELNSEREWVDGEKGGARGSSRCVVLVDDKGLTGMKGRVLYFGLGSTSAKSPWACEYVAQSIADKTVHGGWLVKRIYDEWTQSRSGVGACWFGGDILYAYRWADGSQGPRDNILHVSYNGTGIEDVPMADFDDIGFIREFGMRNSILYLKQ